MDYLSFEKFILEDNPYIQEIEEKGRIVFKDNEYEYFLTRQDFGVGRLYITREGRLVIRYDNQKIIRKRKGIIEINIGAVLNEFLSLLAVGLNGKVVDSTVKVVKDYQVLPLMSKTAKTKGFEEYEGFTIYPLKVVVSESELAGKEILTFSFKESNIIARVKKYFDHCNYESDIMRPFVGIGDYLPSYVSRIVEEKYEKYWSFLSEIIDVVADSISVLFGRDFDVIIEPFDNYFCFPQIDEFFDEKHTLEKLRFSLENKFNSIMRE